MPTSIDTDEDKMIKCHSCSTEVSTDETYPDQHGNEICPECHYELVTTCQICNRDDVYPNEISNIIVVKTELGLTGNRLPGIYRIMRKPFLSIPLIGCGHLHGDDIQFVDKLPRRDTDFYISGHVCKACAAAYQKKAHKIYKPNRFTPKEPWEKINHFRNREIEHTRATVVEYPDMLRDLELDATDFHWTGMQKRHALPDGLPLHHEWLAFHHKNVKVYFTCRGSWTWLTLRPEPQYRETRRQTHLLFAPSGLPTYKKKETEYDYGTSSLWAEPAVIAAIDQGLLRQCGVYDKDGELTYCH